MLNGQKSTMDPQEMRWKVTAEDIMNADKRVSRGQVFLIRGTQAEQGGLLDLCAVQPRVCEDGMVERLPDRSTVGEQVRCSGTGVHGRR
jgi:hypothetical protein